EYISTSPTATSDPRPGLIILHNGFGSSRTHTDIVYTLWTSFNVYIPDRRGRGYSGHYKSDSNLQTEIDDLKAVLSNTGAQYILGVGSGAVLAFYTALQVATSGNEFSIKRIAAFEPLVIPENDNEFGVLRETLEQQTDGSSVKDPMALNTAKKIMQIEERSWWQRMTPNWLDRRQAKKMLLQDQVCKGAYSMKNLLIPLKEECRLWEEMQVKFKTLFGLNQRDVEVLLMSGSESSHHHKMSLQRFSNALERSKVVNFGGMGNLGLSNIAEGSEPERVAIELRKFFIGYGEPTR
ncbi:hypothetical protein N431DRAFT_342774, partial [Stipitochalara longipes BDJ]